MCARTLYCKSKETDWFKWVFIPPIKITVRVFPPIKAKEIPTVGLPSHCLNVGSTKPPEFNEDAPHISKRQEHALDKRKGSGTDGGWDLTSHDESQRISKRSSPFKEPDSRILGAIVGTQNSTASAHFIRGPRPMPRKNKDEQRES